MNVLPGSSCGILGFSATGEVFSYAGGDETGSMGQLFLQVDRVDAEWISGLASSCV